MYDLNDYAGEIRGFYIPLEELPGPIAQDEDRLIEEILNTASWKPDEEYEAFHQKYNPLDDGNASQRVLKAIIKP